MLINKRNDIEGNVKFISYEASRYSWCIGRLVLEINGKEWKFGREWDFSKGFANSQKIPDVYPSFWSSGGGFNKDWCAIMESGKLM